MLYYVFIIDEKFGSHLPAFGSAALLHDQDRLGGLTDHPENSFVPREKLSSPERKPIHRSSWSRLQINYLLVFFRQGTDHRRQEISDCRPHPLLRHHILFALILCWRILRNQELPEGTQFCYRSWCSVFRTIPIGFLYLFAWVFAVLELHLNREEKNHPIQRPLRGLHGRHAGVFERCPPHQGFPGRSERCLQQ